MAFDKIKKFRDNVYKYISKADLFIAFTTILSSLATTTISSMYSYLNDRDAMIIRKRNYPTNHINIDFISEDRYLQIIDEDNWKPARLRDINAELEKHKKEEIQKHKDEDNLPPSIKKVNKIEPVEYFVVSEGAGEFRDPNKFRKNNKQSVRETTKIGKYAGVVGEEQIRHESIFKSIFRVFQGLVGYKDKKKSVVINSNYDKYGRKIKNSYKYQQNGQKVSQKTLKQQQQEEIEKLQSQIAEKERQIAEIREKQEEAMMKVRQFVIDGNLQAMDGYNALNDIATAGNKNSKIVRMLAMLEYKYEQCWYKISKKYSKIPISVDYTIDYDENYNPIRIKMTKLKGRQDLYRKYLQKIQIDAKDTIQNCDISKVDGLTKQKYKYWKQIKLTFKGQD